jgi:type II secretory pathway pseudopilin PulG
MTVRTKDVFRKEYAMKEHKVSVSVKVLVVAVLFGMLLPAVAQAADDTDARIERLEASVRALQAELNALKAERARAAKPPAVDQKQMESMINKVFEENKSDFVAPDWVQNITPFGDFRYRYESLRNKNLAGGEFDNDRRRNRIRARLGFKVKIDDEWDATFRIATGSSDSPTSTNQTLERSFESKDIWLDLGYADWHPESYPGLNVFMGKMKNPFYKVGGNQLIWDSDVNPEGGAASYKWSLNGSTEATVVGGAFWLEERFSDADAGYFGIQGMLKHKFDEDSHLLGGVSYYDIGNIESKSTVLSGVTLMGNTATTPGGLIYEYDFNMVEGFAEYGWKCNGMPVAVFGNYVENTAAPGGRNTAYSIGAQLNKAKKPGSWQCPTQQSQKTRFMAVQSQLPRS